MRKLALGLMLLAFVMPTVVYGDVNVAILLKFDIRNKSDQCVAWIIPHEKNGDTRGYLKRGESALKQVVVLAEHGAPYRTGIEVTVEDCSSRQEIGPRLYDYLYLSRTSNLLIQKESNGAYAISHGPEWKS